MTAPETRRAAATQRLETEYGTVVSALDRGLAETEQRTPALSDEEMEAAARLSRVVHLDPNATDIEHADAAHEIARIVLGIDSGDGAVFSDDGKPLDGKTYHAKMVGMLKNGLASLNTEEAREWDALGDDMEARYKHAVSKKGWWQRNVAEPVSEAVEDIKGWVPTGADYANAPEEIRAAADRAAALKVQYLGQQPEYDMQQAVADRKALDAYHEQVRKRDTIAAYDAKIRAGRVWHHYLMVRDELTDEADGIVQTALRAGGMSPTDFRRFRALEPDQQRMVAALVHDAQSPGPDNVLVAAGNEFVRQLVSVPYGAMEHLSETFARQFMDDDRYQEMARTKALLAEATAPRMRDFGYWGNSVVGVASTLPYMAYAAVPYAGVAMVAAKAAADFENRVAAEGGDVTSSEFQASKWSVAVAYAMVERLQMSLGFGAKPLDDMAKRQAFLKFYLLAKKGYALRSVGAAAVNETVEEGAQKMLEDGFVAYGLGRDIAGEAVRGGLQELHDTAGTMLMTAVAGGGSRVARAYSPKYSLAEKAATLLNAHRFVKAQLEGRVDDMRTYAENLGSLAETWRRAGTRDRAAREFVRNGFDAPMAERLADFFHEANKAVEADPNIPEERKRAFFGESPGPANVLRQAFPDARVEQAQDGAWTITRTINGVETTTRMVTMADDTAGMTTHAAAISVSRAINKIDPERAMTPEEWLSLDDSERAALAIRYRLTNQGWFSMSAGTDGPSVDATDARRVSGQITLTKSANAADALHESLHAMVSYLRAAGQISDSDIQALRREFGKPHEGVDELFDEEAAADAFREYAAGKVDFVPPGPVARIIRAARNMLRAAVGAERAAREDKVIRTAFFRQILDGTYTGVPVAAVPSPESAELATAPTPAPAPAPAPSPAPSAKTPAGAAPAPSATPQAPAAPAAPAPRGGTNVESLKRKDEAAEQAEIRKITDREPGTWEAVTPVGGVRIHGDWIVVDLYSLLTSDMPGYDQSIQPRERGTVPSRDQIEEMARLLDPQRLFESPETDGGSPIVVPNLSVLSGNGRVIALRLAHETGRIAAYVRYVRVRAAQMGIEIPADIKVPVMVRRMTGIDTDGATAQLVAELSNRPKILARTPAEQAEADAKSILRGGLLQLYAPGADGNLMAASNHDFMVAFVRAVSDKNLVDSKGRPTEAAAARVRTAMLALVVGQGEDARDIVRTLVEQAYELGMRREVDGVMRAAGALADQAELRPEFSLLGDMAWALRDYLQWRREGAPGVDQWLRQGDLLNPRPPAVETIIRAMAQRRTVGGVSAMLLDYARRARTALAEPDMFGTPPPAKADLLAQAIASTADEAEAAATEEGKAPETETPPATPTPPAAPAPPSRTPLYTPTARTAKPSGDAAVTQDLLDRIDSGTQPPAIQGEAHKPAAESGALSLGLDYDADQYREETPELPPASPVQWRKPDGSPNPNAPKAMMPYPLTGNKGDLMAAHGLFYAALALRSTEVLDCFGGSALYTIALDAMGALGGKASTVNEFEYCRAVALGQIRDNVDAVVAELTAARDAMAAKFGGIVPATEEQLLAAREALVAWLDEQLQGIVADAKPDPEGHIPLRDDAKTAATYILAQDMVFGNRAITATPGPDGKPEWTKGAQRTSRGEMGAGFPAVGKPFAMPADLRDGTFADTIRKVSETLKKAKVQMGDGWHLAKLARKGALVLMDTSYYAQRAVGEIGADASPDSPTTPLTYGQQTAEDTDPTVWIRKMREVVATLTDDGSSIDDYNLVATNNWDDRIVEAVEAMGFRVARAVRFNAGQRVVEMVAMTGAAKAIVPAVERQATPSGSGAQRYSIVGTLGAMGHPDAMIVVNNAMIAADMRGKGMDPLRIKLATGWERGSDGRWRFEVEPPRPSTKAKKQIDKYWSDYHKWHKARRAWAKSGFVGEGPTRPSRLKFPLRELLGAKSLKLFSAMYPKLVESSFVVYDFEEQLDGSRGQTDPIPNKPLGYVFSIFDHGLADAILVHEIQHAIQYMEGFDPGDSPSSTRAQYYPARRAFLKQLAEDLALKIKHLAADAAKYPSDQSIRDDLEDAERELSSALAERDSLPDDPYDAYRRAGGEVEARNAAMRSRLPMDQRRSTLLTSTEDVDAKDKLYLRHSILAQTRPPLPGPRDDRTWDLFGSWNVREANRSPEGRVVVGWRGVKDLAARNEPQHFGATEGEGIYVAKDRQTAEWFGTPTRVEFEMPKRALFVDEDGGADGLILLHEGDNLGDDPEAVLAAPEGPGDSDWLIAHKRAFARNRDDWWHGNGAMAATLTEEILKLGYDAVYVRSGGEEWTVLMRDQDARIDGRERYSVASALPSTWISDEGEDVDPATLEWRSAGEIVASELVPGVTTWDFMQDGERIYGERDPREVALAFLEMYAGYHVAVRPTDNPAVFAVEIADRQGNEKTFFDFAPIRAPKRLEEQRHSVQATPPDDADALGFYSLLRRVVAEKMGGRMTVGNLRRLADPAKGLGIKAEEIEWSGFGYWLDSMPDDRVVTREEALAAIEDYAIQELSTDATDGEPSIDSTLYEEYALPGADEYTYAERLLVVKSVSDIAAARIERADAVISEAYQRMRRLEAEWSRSRAPEMRQDYERAKADVARWQAYRDRQERIMERAESAPHVDYHSGHWSGFSNVLLHLRTDERTIRSRFDIPDIERRIVEAVGARSAESLGSGAGDAAVRKGAITQTESDAYNDHRGFTMYGPDGKPRKAVGVGKRIFFVEEIQSDWHQEGREKGYAVAVPREAVEEEAQKLRDAGVQEETVRRFIEDSARLAIGDAVPDAPFKDTSKGWARLAMKRAFRLAVEEGIRTLAWTTGEAQVERYSLGRVVDKLIVEDAGSPNGKQHYRIYGFKGGSKTYSGTTTAPELPNMLGKDLARKAVEQMSKRGEKSPAMVAAWDAYANAAQAYLDAEKRSRRGRAFIVLPDVDGTFRVVRSDDRSIDMSNHNLESTATVAAANYSVGFHNSRRDYTPAMRKARDAMNEAYEAWRPYEELGMGAIDDLQTSVAFEGEDLKLGGHGMREFYDVLLPRIANDLGKKYGTQTTDMTIPHDGSMGDTSQLEREGIRVHAIEIPEAMAQDILAGQPRFSVAASRPLPSSPAKADLQALADGMRGRDLSIVCTDCARAVVRKAGRGAVVGYFSDRNPEAAVGRDEGGHDVALIDGRWVVDTWYRSAYDAEAPAVLDLADPDDRATARRLYGDPKTWEPASKPEADPHAAEQIAQAGFLATAEGAVYAPPQRRFSFAAYYGHASGEPSLAQHAAGIGPVSEDPRLRGYPGAMQHLIGRGQHDDGITVWESPVPSDWFAEPGLRYDTMHLGSGRRYTLEIDADAPQSITEGEPIRTDIARSLNTQALVRQVDIEFGANTLGHNVPSRLNAHFARLRGSHPHDPEVERETTAFLVAAGIRAIRYAAHPNPRHPIETYPRTLVIDPSAIRIVESWPSDMSTRTETMRKFQEKHPLRLPAGLPGIADAKHSVDALRPRSSPESGALAVLTVRALEGKEPTAEDAEKTLRLFRAKGLAPDEAVKRAKAYAQGTVGQAAKAAMLTGTPQEAVRKVEQAAELDAAVLAAAGIGAAAGARLGRTAEEAANRALRRAVVEATGTDLQELVVDTGADLTATMLNVLPETFGPSARREEGDDGPVDLEAQAGDGTGDAGEEPAEEQPEPQATPEQLADRDQRCRNLVEMVKAWHAQYQARRKKRDEEREARRKQREAEGLPELDEEAEEAEEADDGEEMAVGPIPKELLRAASVDLSSAMELARFMRIWTGDWIVRRSEGALTPQTVWRDREAVERYRRTMQQQLRQMAAGLLADGDASQRLVAEMVGEIPSTSNAHEIERRTASVLRVIQRNAIRQTRDKLTRDLAKALKERGAQGRLFAPMEEDLKRKVTAESEEMARYLARVVRMNGKAVERERERLAQVLADRAKLYDEAQDSPATDVATDREYHYALVRQALLDRYGGLRQQLPAEILRAGAEIEEWLTSEQERLRVRWHQIAERNQILSDAIANAVAPADVDRPKLRETWWDRLTDSLIATVRQRLQDAVKLAPSDDVRRTAYQAIDEAMYHLSRGAELYATRQKAYRDEWYDLVAEVAGGKAKVPEYMRHLNEPIPAEVSRAVSRQGYAGTMTYGQAMQLYASLTQEFYQANVAEHGRHRHADLIASVLTPADLKLVQRLRTVYESRRQELSDAVQAVTGVPVWRPDPLYMPVRMLVGNREGLRAHGVRNWSPLAATLTPRVRNRKDFDESASIQGVYWERAKDNAAAIAYGENGIRVRGIVGRANVKDAIERYHGPRRAGELYRQIEEALMGERAPTTQPHEKIMERVLRLNTYVSLSWNPLSTVKQMLSFPVWAMYLPDGFAGLHRAFGESVRNPQTLREFIDSDGFRARYGSGVMTEIRDVLTEPGTNPVKRFYQLGMRGIQFGDAVPSLLVGAGLYRARRDALIDQGMDPEAAAIRAKTEAWAMVEETQQSSRPENLIPLYRNGGVLARAFLQFASAPVLQLSHEVQAIRNAKAGVPGAREAAVRAVLVNHLVMPALMRGTTLLFQAILGDLPEEEEIPDYALWFLYDCVLGPFSRVFLVGQWATTAYDAVVRRKRTPFARLLPAENVFRLTETLGVTAHDLLTLRTEDLQKDFMDVLRDTSSPGRQIVRFWRNRVAEED